MPIEFYLVLLIGIVIIYFGYLILSGKAPFIVNFFNFIPEYDPRLLKILGTFVIVVGVIIVLLPFILGVESMNTLH